MKLLLKTTCFSGVGIYKDSHIVCQNSASIMQIWFNGDKTAELDTSDLLEVKTRNNANLYIGSKGHVTQNDGIISDKNNNPPPNNRFFNGNIGYVNSVNNSPYLGNTFYQNGFATITHPNYYDILINPTYGIADGTATNTTGDGMVIGYNFDITGNEGIYNLKFQGSHLMYEHEYQCTVDEHEFNKTTNPSARSKEPNKQHEIANIQTGSLFKPYVTTIGLYNENNELLVVGKLGQPIRMSDKTDTTFIMRWDT